MKSMIKTILQVIRRLDYIILYRYYCLLYKEDKNSVLFLSDSRETLTGNFYYIHEKIKEDYKIRTHFYKSTQVKHNKKAICKDMAVSKYILVDDFYPLIYPIPLRKSTKLIQVWHALGAFKTVGFARKGNKDKYSMTHRNYTDAIVSSDCIRKDYAKAFRMNVKDIHSIGIPRTDVFFDEEYKEKTRERLYNKYPLLKDKKVILFAPTFRGNNIHNAYYDYDKLSFETFKNELQEQYVCIFKMHPFVKNKPLENLDSDFYLDLTDEREINDLLFITDILITDYSSVIFEAALLNIKTIFFAYDLNEYISNRDFFYSYETYTYGSVVKNENELFDAIRYGENDALKLNEFKNKFISSCDGCSTERFINVLLKE